MLISDRTGVASADDETRMALRVVVASASANSGEDSEITRLPVCALASELGENLAL